MPSKDIETEAQTGLALVLASGQQVGLTGPEQVRRDAAIAHAERAIEPGGISTVVLRLAGCALCDAGQALQGKTILECAFSFDAGHPQALAARGSQLLPERDANGAVGLLRQAIRTSPQDNTMAVWRSVLALAHARAGNLEAALKEAKSAVLADDRTYLSRVTLAAVHLMREDKDHAAVAIGDARRVTPDLT